MATNEEILIPKALIIPIKTAAGSRAVSEIFISGAEIYFMSGATVKKITSA